MSQIDAQAGNSGFSIIRNGTTQIPKINCADANVVKFVSGNLQTVDAYYNTSSFYPLNKKLITVNLQTNNNNLWWGIGPNPQSLTTDGTTVYRFPTDCFLVSATISTLPILVGTNATYNIGLNAAINTTSNNILNGGKLANMNSVIKLSTLPIVGGVGNCTIGGDGAPPNLPISANDYVSITTATTANTSGKVFVTLVYYV